MSRQDGLFIPPVAGRFWLLLALGMVILPHLTRQPLWFSVGCAAVLGWRIMRDLNGWALPRKWARVLITLLGISAVLSTYQTLLGRDPGVAMLTMMLCLKLVELRTMRDAMVVIFMGYFLVVAGFLYSQSMLTGIYMFAVVLALTTALITLNHPQATLGSSRRHLRTAGGLLLQSLPLMVVLFVLFPRIPTPLWGLPKDAFAGRTGLSEEMTLGNITELADSDEVAFRAVFDGALPAAGQLYWRGPIFWATDGRRWTHMRRLQMDRERAAEYTGFGDPVSYTVTLEPQSKGWVFALDLPGQLPEGLADVALTMDFQLLSTKPLHGVVRYGMTSYLNYATGALSRADREMALRLPEGPNPWSRVLAEGWLSDGLSGAELVERALQYFREEPFYYSRRPPLLGQDPVDQFLFESRRGFCEHYAAAFVYLMRAAGVPARVVTGYQGGELNPVGNYLVVRQSDAHAWAEVWLPERGWVRVDPTAVVPSDRIETPGDIQRFASTEPRQIHGTALAWLAQGWQKIGQTWDAIDNAWNQWVLGFDTGRQAELLRSLGLRGIDWQGMALLLVGTLAALFSAVALYLLAWRPRAADPVAAAYRLLCRKLAKAGLERGRAEGPQDFARRVASARPEAAEAVVRITGDYVRLRYGRERRTAEEVRRLRRAVARFRVS